MNYINRFFIFLFIFVFIFLIMPSNGKGDPINGWEIEKIDIAKYSEFQFELDKYNNPHVIYNIHRIKEDEEEYQYVHKINNDWIKDNLPFSNGVSKVSFQLDGNDQPHIVYCQNSAIYYSKKTSYDWSNIKLNDIGNELYGGGMNYLCIDNNDNPHIIYTKAYGSDFYFVYQRFENGEWNTSKISLEITSTSYLDMMRMILDENGVPHISYYKDGIKYMTFNGFSWIIENVDVSEGVGPYLSLTIDMDQNLYISYNDDENDFLKIATKKNGIWEVEVIDDDFLNNPGAYNSLRIDNSNDIQVSYRAECEMRYAKKENGLWNIYYFDVEEEGSSHEPIELEIDNNRNPHIVYYRPEDDSIRYAVLSGNPDKVEDRLTFYQEHDQINIGLILIPLLIITVISVSYIVNRNINKKKMSNLPNGDNYQRYIINDIIEDNRIKPRKQITLSIIILGVVLMIMIILPFVPFWANGEIHYQETSSPNGINIIEEEYHEDFSIFYRSGNLKYSYIDNKNNGNNSFIKYQYLPGGGEFPSEIGSEGWKNDIIIPNGPLMLIIYYLGPCLSLIILFNLILNRNNTNIKEIKIKIMGIITSGLIFVFPLIFFLSFELYKYISNYNNDFSRYYDHIHMGFAFLFCLSLSIPILIITFFYNMGRHDHT